MAAARSKSSGLSRQGETLIESRMLSRGLSAPRTSRTSPHNDWERPWGLHGIGGEAAWAGW